MGVVRLPVGSGNTEAVEEELSKMAGWLQGARRVVVLTGAGISTESGIPDFRGPGGFWERNDASKYTIQNWLRDPEHRKQQWKAAVDGRLRGFGFVEMSTSEEAQKAITALNGTQLGGRSITVNEAKPQEKTGGRFGGGGGGRGDRGGRF